MRDFITTKISKDAKKDVLSLEIRNSGKAHAVPDFMRFKNFEERIFGRNKRKDTQKGFTAPPCPSLHWNTAPTASWGSPVLKRKLLIRVCAKITSDFGGSAAGP
ncbi:MAG TPA: hypothetical protein PKW32_14370, partial [Verrucomicrobiota bacterium]|nr:hypothetical protein [Verrucomicrobiota bacterium]